MMMLSQFRSPIEEYVDMRWQVRTPMSVHDVSPSPTNENGRGLYYSVATAITTKMLYPHLLYGVRQIKSAEPATRKRPERRSRETRPTVNGKQPESKIMVEEAPGYWHSGNGNDG